MRSNQLPLSVLILLLLGLPAEAANYTVKAGGGGNFATIQACANAAVAGDTCTVYAGTYSETVTVPTSGTAGSPITFQVNPGDAVSVRGFSISNKNYITIGGSTTGTGFEITGAPNTLILLSATSHITIQNNNIHHGGTTQCIRNDVSISGASHYVTVKDNTISWCGQPPASPTTGIYVNGDHWLVDGNSISHSSDYISVYGSYNVIRNITFGPVAVSDFPGTGNPLHVDGVETSCSGDLPVIHLVIEGSTMTDNTVPNGHFTLLHDPGCGGFNGAIVRFNAILNVGSAFVNADSPVPHSKEYNNSVSGIVSRTASASDFRAGQTDGASINSIFYNAVSTSNAVVNQLDGGSSPTFVMKNDLAYNTSATTWASPMSTCSGCIRNSDPKFISPSSNLHLQASSPARGAGTNLTTVASGDTGSGTAVILNDAGFFQDGYGITGVQADWIRVGASTTVQIASINYTTNTLTLVNAITRAAGDPVYLYKKSDGAVVLFGSVPDIGAYQFGTTGAPPTAPTNLRIIP